MLSNNWITTYPSRFETKLDAPKPLYKTGSSCSFTLHSCNPSTAFASPALDYPAPLFTIAQCIVQRPRASREDPAVRQCRPAHSPLLLRPPRHTGVGEHSWRFNTQTSYILHTYQIYCLHFTHVNIFNFHMKIYNGEMGKWERQLAMRSLCPEHFGSH